MRGGLQRWKRGVSSQGVRQAVDYAFGAACDSHLRSVSGAEALAHYGEAEASGDVDVTRFTATSTGIEMDTLDRGELIAWVDGRDPSTGERRGRELNRADADLVLDGTINAPKSYSVASLLNEELADEFEALQDRLRDRIVATWQRELNARRGAGGLIREGLAQVEVVELQHRRSRALDPHIHRHLWLNVRVLGEDGRWSNLDSRVAMKLHTVINAEGDLAARTDPEWVAALARHGYTLNGDGEIAELAHVIRPVSRRSNQIEANRAMKLAEWREANPGEEPSADVLTMIDRWAWAEGRPNKPKKLSEDEWEDATRAELNAIDPTIVRGRRPVTVAGVAIADLDRDFLAAVAVVDADARAAGTGGRYSMFDVRAGALRAIAASGVVADRDVLGEVADDVVARAQLMSVDVLGEANVPPHVKQLMSVDTAAAKVDLAAAFDRLNEPGVAVPAATVREISDDVLGAGRSLDAGQVDAAAAIAGTDRLCTITGPAGTGKTTLLKVAKEALRAQGRRMVVVAPTKKAASVDSRELGTTAGSVHALLLDHGWRWSTDTTGSTVWTRLEVGDVDEHTGAIYEGPRRYPVTPGDRIVVDEAGMLDLHVACALADVAERTGAGIAMVGDHLQAMPVGHSGAMATMKNRSGAVVELSAVHRFEDPAYAELSLRLREPETVEDARAVVHELTHMGLVRTVANEQEARDHMVETYLSSARGGRRVALVTSTNAEAQQINEAIQERLVDADALSARQVAVGQNEQRLLVGDIVQTRRNDAGTDVENRALWRVHSITNAGVRLSSLTDAADVRDVTAEYVAEHVHLAYASTVHGVQGETVAESIVGPGVNAAGLYVGMTRGRERNEAVVIARDEDSAVDELAETMMRGQQEVTMSDAAAAAARELARAARTPQGPRVIPPWHDRKARPFGMVPDLDARFGDVDEKFRTARDEVERVNDRLALAVKTLRTIDVRVARLESRGHADVMTGGDGPDLAALDALLATRDTLRQRVDDTRARRQLLVQDYGKFARIVDGVTQERAFRGGLEPERAVSEAMARNRHAETASNERTRPPEGPHTGLGGRTL